MLARPAEQIAEIVGQAANDATDHVTFVAGEDAKTTHALRLAIGIDAFRTRVRRMFPGARLPIERSLSSLRAIPLDEAHLACTLQ